MQHNYERILYNFLPILKHAYSLESSIYIITKWSFDFSEYFNSPDSGYILVEDDSKANGADMSVGVDVKKLAPYTGS